MDGSQGKAGVREELGRHRQASCEDGEDMCQERLSVQLTEGKRRAVAACLGLQEPLQEHVAEKTYACHVNQERKIPGSQHLPQGHTPKGHDLGKDITKDPSQHSALSGQRAGT